MKRKHKGSVHALIARIHGRKKGHGGRKHGGRHKGHRKLKF